MASHTFTPAATPADSANTFWQRWWQALAYRHQAAEWLIYFMFASGILLWDVAGLNWSLQRLVLPSHMLVGATAFSVIVGLFWSAHRRLLQHSKKRLLRVTGSVIEWLLAACTVSGFYLFLWGNTGNTLGWLMSELHFYTTWLLVPLVFRHAMRWSVLKLIK